MQRNECELALFSEDQDGGTCGSESSLPSQRMLLIGEVGKAPMAGLMAK